MRETPPIILLLFLSVASIVLETELKKWRKTKQPAQNVEAFSSLQVILKLKTRTLIVLKLIISQDKQF